MTGTITGKLVSQYQTQKLAQKVSHSRNVWLAPKQNRRRETLALKDHAKIRWTRTKSLEKCLATVDSHNHCPTAALFFHALTQFTGENVRARPLDAWRIVNLRVDEETSAL